MQEVVGRAIIDIDRRAVPAAVPRQDGMCVDPTAGFRRIHAAEIPVRAHMEDQTAPGRTVHIAFRAMGAKPASTRRLVLRPLHSANLFRSLVLMIKLTVPLASQLILRLSSLRR